MRPDTQTATLIALIISKMFLKVDGKWSWSVFISVTLFLCLETGTIKAFSVLLADMKEQLSIQTWIIGSCVSIILGCGYLIGLSAGMLVNKFHARTVLMVSGLLSSVGVIICALSINAYMLVTGCMLTGFLLLGENVAFGILPDYFDTEYLTIVINVSLFAGTTFGVIMAPLITQALLGVYGWRGTLILINGLNVHTVCFAAFIKPARKKYTSKHLHPPIDTISRFASIYKALGVTLLCHISFIAQVIVPAFIHGYTVAGWMIYIVSFASSKGATLKEASLVATCGGFGMTMSRIALAFLFHKYMTYKQIMYMASFILTVSFGIVNFLDSVIALCIASASFGTGFGMIGSEIYIAIKVITDDLGCESQYTNGCSWYHLSYGVGTIMTGSLTGGLYDITGSFMWSFFIFAGISSLIAVSLALNDIWTAVKGKSMLRSAPM